MNQQRLQASQVALLHRPQAVMQWSAAPQVTALWVTHRLEELEWADTVSYMDNGRIQFSGSPQDARVYLEKLGAHV